MGILNFCNVIIWSIIVYSEWKTKDKINRFVFIFYFCKSNYFQFFGFQVCKSKQNHLFNDIWDQELKTELKLKKQKKSRSKKNGQNYNWTIPTTMHLDTFCPFQIYKQKNNIEQKSEKNLLKQKWFWNSFINVLVIEI